MRPREAVCHGPGSWMAHGGEYLFVVYFVPGERFMALRDSGAGPAFNDIPYSVIYWTFQYANLTIMGGAAKRP